MCSFDDSTGLEMKVGNEKRVLETGGSGFKEDGARTTGVDSPADPSPGRI